jgi:hypothetical protein
LTELNDNSNLQTSTRAGLRALEVATLTAQRQAVDATGKLRELRAFVAAQAADFKITWTWDGTIHFVQTDDRLLRRALSWSRFSRHCKVKIARSF